MNESSSEGAGSIPAMSDDAASSGSAVAAADPPASSNDHSLAPDRFTFWALCAVILLIIVLNPKVLPHADSSRTELPIRPENIEAPTAPPTRPGERRFCRPFTSDSWGKWVRVVEAPDANAAFGPVARREREMSKNLTLERTTPCDWRVNSFDTFLSELNGRTLIFAGDSTIREIVFDFLRTFANCECRVRPAKGAECAPEVDEDDPPMCSQIFHAHKSYYQTQYFTPHRGGLSVNLTYTWLAYPMEAINVNPIFQNIVERKEIFDVLVMSCGLWPMRFVGSSDADGGAAALEESKSLVEFMKWIAENDFELHRKIVWRSVLTTEMDDASFNTDKRFVSREVIDANNAATLPLWQAAGYPVWDMTPLSDARMGGAERAHNEKLVTYDGIHFGRENNVVISWEFFSYAASLKSH